MCSRSFVQVKVLFYMICTMAEDPVTSRKGGVVVLYYVGDFSRIPMDFEFPTLSARAQQACPLRFSAAHVCLLSTNKVARSFLSTALKLSQTKTVQHVKVHQGNSLSLSSVVVSKNQSLTLYLLSHPPLP